MAYVGRLRVESFPFSFLRLVVRGLEVGELATRWTYSVGAIFSELVSVWR